MPQVNLEKFNNSWYNPGKSTLTRIVWHVLNYGLLRSAIPGSFWRRFLLRLFSAKIGKGVVIKPKVCVKYPWNLEVGNHSWIGENVWIDNLGLVKIGAHCCVSQNALFICGNHNYKKTSFDLMVEPIVLHNGAWVGASACLSPGTVLEENAVLSMGSTATGLLKKNTIYQGNPAAEKKLRVIEE